MESNASICTSALIVGVILFLADPAIAETDLGVVLDVRGQPVVTDPFGTRRRLEVLQGLAEGDTLDVGVGDSVLVCNEAVQFVYRIEGPGAVGVARAGFGAVRGAPRITSVGACDENASPDANGGVILRTLRRHQRTP